MTRLIADIGGTNARFAFVEEGAIRHIEVLACADYDSVAEAAKAYQKKIGRQAKDAVFAIAAPLDGSDHVKMMNHHWQFSIQQTKKEINLNVLHVINDFTAVAHGIPHLTDQDIYRVNDAVAQKGAPVAVIGAGTGLGVAGIVFDHVRPVVVTTEGGHVTMPASSLREFQIFDWLKKEKYSHVSAERVISGKGMVNLYAAISALDRRALPEKNAAEITSAALDKTCPVCVETLDLFCHFLGVIAGNLALSYGAFGGLYIAGGIVPKLGDYFAQSRFYDSFTAKGRYKEYLSRIPIAVVTHPQPGLLGLQHYMP